MGLAGFLIAKVMMGGSKGDNEPILHTIPGTLLTIYGVLQLVLGKVR